MNTHKRQVHFKFWIWIAPWLAGFVLLTLIPLLGSLYISFTKWLIINDPEWIGLENYRELLDDPYFLQSLKVTFQYCGLTIPITVISSLALAMLLNGDLPFAGTLRTIFYLPCVISSVASSLLWGWIFNYRFGLLNNVLAVFGVAGPNWLGDQGWALIALAIMSLWGVGGGIIFYLAGLQTVPIHLIEAAKIAGAGWWRRLFTITLPSMSPILLFSVLTNLIGGLQTFTSSFMLTAGGPNSATLFYALYLYQNAFTYHKMGKACALAWVLFLIIMVLSLLVLRVSKPLIYYENDEEA
ncbi:MAG: carbohydrate ABC transporter permease [Atopobiaceae bacterium]|jgi:multiple sugar transport system permease protein